MSTFVTERQLALVESGDLTLTELVCVQVDLDNHPRWWVLDARPDGGPVLGVRNGSAAATGQDFRGAVRYVAGDEDTREAMAWMERSLREWGLLDPPQAVLDALADGA